MALSSPQNVLFLFQESLEANQNLTWEDIKENIPPNALVLGTLQDDSSPPSSGFCSVLGYALYLARKFNALKNDKTLLYSMEEVFVKMNQVYAKHNKEAFGSTDVEVSDILDAVRHVKKVRLEALDVSENENKTTASVAKEYLKALKAGNIVDPFEVLAKLRTKLEDDDSGLRQHLQQVSSLLIVRPNFDDSKSVEFEIFKALFPDISSQKLSIESPLDASVTEGHTRQVTISLEPVQSEELATAKGSVKSKKARSVTEMYCQGLVQGYIRLLVNSRDELALGRIICGPCGVLDHKAFTSIKQESGKTNMPMYQTLVSYVQKLKLGGKSYAPTEDHPFFDYNKDLIELVEFMEKLHDKIEDEKDEGEAVRKVAACLKSQVLKSGKVGSAAVNASLGVISSQLERAVVDVKERTEGQGTPKRDVGSGGSMAGRKTMKVIREFVDYHSSEARHINLHELLGKLQTTQKGTPLAGPSITTLFTSPVEELKEESVDEEEEASLGTRLGLNDAKEPKKNEPAKPKFLGAPRFGSTLSWAVESSPVAISSEERIYGPARTGGVTLVAAEQGDSTPKRASSKEDEELEKVVKEVETCLENEGLKKAQSRADEILKESKALRRAVPKKTAPKRSILEEINNMKGSKIVDKMVKEDKKAKARTKRVYEGQENQVQAKKPKTKKPKTLPQVKGQTKMTAFFRI